MKKIVNVVLALLVALSIIACGKSKSIDNGNTIIVACSPVPHAEIMNEIAPMMKEKGFDLVVKEFSDYVQPNLAVDQGEVHANYFQHQPYLDDFNAERGTKINTIISVHYEPFGIYAGSKNSLALSEGDKVAVPNDPTNEARALNLLADAGLIKLKSDAGLKATKLDIVENEYNIEIVELESAQIPRALDSVSLACMNGNYAIEAGYKVRDALYIEKQDSIAARTYANIVCVKEGNEDKDWAIALAECVKSDTVKKFIEGKYDKSVIYMD